MNITTKDGAVIVDGSQATSFTVASKEATRSFLPKLGSLNCVQVDSLKQIAAGENAVAGTPIPQNRR